MLQENNKILAEPNKEFTHFAMSNDIRLDIYRM